MISRYYNNARVIPILYLVIFFIGGCVKDRGQESRLTADSTDTIEATLRPSFNVRLVMDGSASMKMYLSTSNTFRYLVDAVSPTLNSKYKTRSSLEVFNDSSQVDIYKDHHALLNTIIKEEFNANRSKLHELFRYALSKKEGVETVSIVITDGILDIPGSSSIEKRLADAKSTITHLFSNKESYATILYKFESEVKGTYWDLNQGRHTLGFEKSVERPFYVFITGPQYAVEELIELFQKPLQKCTNMALLGFDQIPIQMEPFRRIGRKGAGSLKADARTFQGANPTFDQPLCFIAGIDLSAITRYKEYDLSYVRQNLEVLNHYNKDDVSGITLMTRQEMEQSNDWKDPNKQALEILSNYPHFAKVTFSNPNDSIMVIQLKDVLPKWVGEYSSDSDLDIKNGGSKKTFGLRYLVEGIYNGYKNVNLSPLFREQYMLQRTHEK